MAETATLRLTLLNLDLQIVICTLLHPFDILALRRTCKALQLATRQRVVWLIALHRICLDNTLFLPSFPIPEMSDVELEQAALAPRRWIELCATVEKRHHENSGVTLHPRTSRVIDAVAYMNTGLFIVPGGRYLVSSSPNGIFVWDLGYTSNANCKLVASLELELGSFFCIVQANLDNMGLTIFLYHALFKHCNIYEIFPQHESPQMTQIAHLDFDPFARPQVHLSPATLMWYGFYHNRIVFRVWDYRLDHSIGFSGDVDLGNFQWNLEVIATKTAIVVVYEEAILIWAIPPLLPQSPDFFNDNLTLTIPPLFRVAFPEGIARPPNSRFEVITTSSWYLGSSQPLYFHITFWDSKVYSFELIIKPDFSDASLRLLNTFEFSCELRKSMLEEYRICEDNLVSLAHLQRSQSGVFMWSRSPRLNPTSHGGHVAKIPLPANAFGTLCPASGRFAYSTADARITVIDFF